MTELHHIAVETPEPAFVEASLETIAMTSAPHVRAGKTVRLIAAIETPLGVRILA